MPKLKKSTVRFKAKALTKPYIKSDLNQSEVARKMGVTRQTINERIHKKPVQDALSKYFNSRKTAKKVALRMNEGLDAMKPAGKEEIEDLHCRHKYITTYMQATGRIKTNGNGHGNQTNIIIYGYRNDTRDNPSALRQSEERLGTSA